MNSGFEKELERILNKVLPNHTLIYSEPKHIQALKKKIIKAIMEEI